MQISTRLLKSLAHLEQGRVDGQRFTIIIITQLSILLLLEFRLFLLLPPLKVRQVTWWRRAQWVKGKLLIPTAELWCDSVSGEKTRREIPCRSLRGGRAPKLRRARQARARRESREMMPPVCRRVKSSIL